MEALLSVIIPVYRVEDYLHECVDSVLAQAYGRLEVILVDDGSPDGCPAICDEYAAKDARIRVLHQANQGLSAARNAGLDVADGQYIAFVDSDDYVSPDYFEAAMKMFRSKPGLDLVELPLMARFNTPKATRYAPNKTFVAEGHEQVFPSWFRQQGYLRAYSQLKVYCRRLFDNVRFPVGKTFEDLHIIPEVLLQCKSIAFVAHPTANYFYRWRDESITVQARWQDLHSQVTALLHIGTTAEQFPAISRQDWTRFTMETSNILIDTLRAARREGITLHDGTYEPLQALLDAHKPKILGIYRLNVSANMKAKATALALLGIKRYLRLFC